MQRGRSRGDGGRDRSGAAGPGSTRGLGPPGAGRGGRSLPGLQTDGACQPLDLGLSPPDRGFCCFTPLSLRSLYEASTVAVSRGCRGRPWGRGRGQVGAGIPDAPHSFPAPRGEPASPVPGDSGRPRCAPFAVGAQPHRTRGSACVPEAPTSPASASPQTHPPPAPRRHAHPHRGWPRSFSRPFRGAMRLRGEHTQLEARFGVSVKNWVL